MSDEHWVEIWLEGPLAKYLGNQGGVRLEPGQAVMEAAAHLGIPPNRAFVALVNGQVCDLDYRLAPGDRVRLIPPVAGGSGSDEYRR